MINAWQKPKHQNIFLVSLCVCDFNLFLFCCRFSLFVVHVVFTLCPLPLHTQKKNNSRYSFSVRTNFVVCACKQIAFMSPQFSSSLFRCSSGWEHAFLKLTWQAVDSFNTPYDYSSIMHYKLNAFSRSRRKKTIVPKQNVRARPYRKISKIDALQVKRMYNCYGKTLLAFLS